MKQFWVFELWPHYQINTEWEVIHDMIILHVKHDVDAWHSKTEFIKS